MNNVYIPKSQKNNTCREGIYQSDQIFKLVEEYFGVTREHLLTKKRTPLYLYPRQVCQWLLWKYSVHNAKGIGVLFDQCDNTASENSVKAINRYLDTDDLVRKQIEELERKLKS